MRNCHASNVIATIALLSACNEYPGQSARNHANAIAGGVGGMRHSGAAGASGSSDSGGANDGGTAGGSERGGASGNNGAGGAVAAAGSVQVGVAGFGAGVSYTPGLDPWHRKPGRGKVVDPGTFVTEEPAAGSFPLVALGKATPLVVSSSDYAGVVRAVNDLRKDISSVTAVEPVVRKDGIPDGVNAVVMIGTLGKSPLIDALVDKGKLDVSGIRGRWETSQIEVLENPVPGVAQALVVVGSDQRGTIFGIYELSRQIGVSPWYFWDDVPPRRRNALYIDTGRHSQGEPAVKFRGFFINDENPVTAKWASKQFGPGKAVVPKASCAPSGNCTYSNVSYPSGLTHEYWEKVFEVALRMKANYIWPAVWGRQFADDDPANLPTARNYGIVVGTSHEAPMMRGIEEWKIRVDPTTRDASGAVTHQGGDPWGGSGEWAWTRNATALKKYWREGIQRMVDVGFDGVVTLAMRGTGDIAADETGNIDVLSQVIDAQRTILTDVTKQPATAIPQVWLLYKEVQTYWDRGMRAPDDVTIIWCDDNWGNLRKLQDSTEPERGGGYGIYYHFDYVGAGRNYKWVDTNLVPNIWEQLHLAYSYGVDRLWVVNVGDMKNEELPLQFFLDYAWNPERWPVERLATWEEQWAEQQFGPKYAKEIASILHEYAKLQSDRKPELTNRKITRRPSVDIETEPSNALYYSDEAYFARGGDGKLLPVEQRTYYDDNPFSLTNYREMETVVESWNKLSAEAKRVEALLLGEIPEAKDAYFELVGYPVQASANLYALRQAQFKNLLYYSQKRAATSALAASAEARLADDAALSAFYNTTLAGGKWAGWQTQPKIGYGDQDRYGIAASWQQPESNGSALDDALFPLVKRLDVSTVPATLGVAVDGSDAAYGSGTTAALPTFSRYQTQPAQFVEVFNAGNGSFTFQIQSPTWLEVDVTPDTRTLDTITQQVRANFRVNWASLPEGTASATVEVSSSNGASVSIPVRIESPQIPSEFSGFVESNGYVSVESDHYSKKVDASPITWLRVPDIGRTGSGMTPLPVDAPSQTPLAGGSTPRLEYQLYLTRAAADKPVTVYAYLSPRNNVRRNASGGKVLSTNGAGLRYAISMDSGDPVTVDINVGCDDINLNKPWAWHTSDNINITASKHSVTGSGVHTLKFWMVDPTVVLQKLVVDTGVGELQESYFGPPESYQVKR